MRWVRSQSVQVRSAVTVWLRKKDGDTRLPVASQATALTPSSQNSNEDPCSGSPPGAARAMEAVGRISLERGGCAREGCRPLGVSFHSA